MKKSHIILIVLIAAVSAILISTFTSSVDSSTFSEARQKPGEKVKITGTFDKTAAVEYDALKDASLTVFSVIDSKGESHRVYLHDKAGKPLGLDYSESITIEGKIGDDGNFHASNLLMKCPSKYNDQNHTLDTAASVSN
ncbi:MAG: cytochrome c maturation protein CcmE [Crocinitomicaceae bacterium]|nr:cytochrome c maturation protein CcmE [Crocinitomicaceae bacterium]